MNTTKIISAAALASAVALSMVPVAANAASQERCYGVVKAGNNDCKSAAHACAGQSSKDASASEFVLVPAGLCNKLENGSTSAGGKMKSDGKKK